MESQDKERQDASVAEVLVCREHGTNAKTNTQEVGRPGRGEQLGRVVRESSSGMTTKGSSKEDEEDCEQDVLAVISVC